MTEEISNKVLQYEIFLNETLRNDLRKILEARDKLYSQIAEYLQLRNVIERIKETDLSKDALKTKVDLGCNYYVQANIPDASHIFVCIGYGFFVEFTLDEALKFIEKKTTSLTSQAESLTQDAAKVKAHIKLVLEGLREIQNIDERKEKDFRDIWS